MEDATAIPEQGRGGLGRAFLRIKRAVGRFSATRDVPTRFRGVVPLPAAPSPPQQTTNESLLVGSAAPMLSHESADVQGLPATDVLLQTTDTPTAAIPVVPLDHNAPLEAGFDDEDNNNDHPAQTKPIYERYGIAYEESAPADGGGYVQRGIRIKIRWDCHECKVAFKGSKTCASCGHERCAECPKRPAEKVRELLGGTTALQEIEEKVAHTREDNDSILVPVSIGSAAWSQEHAQVEEVLAPAVPSRGSLDDANDDYLDIPQLRYSIRRSARPVVQLVLRPKMGATDGRLGMYEANGGDGTLERVYRKPRQRVRWTCDRCHATTPSSTTKRCAVCGHERCEDCVRSPRRKTTVRTAAPVVGQLPTTDDAATSISTTSVTPA